VLAKRIIPCLDVDQGRVVKGIRFVRIVDAGDPVEQSKRYDAEGADELTFLDITASSDNREIVAALVRRVCCMKCLSFHGGRRLCFVPTRRHSRSASLREPTKFRLTQPPLSSPDLISEGAELFGSQCMVASIVPASQSERPRAGPVGEVFYLMATQADWTDRCSNWAIRVRTAGLRGDTFDQHDSDARAMARPGTYQSHQFGPCAIPGNRFPVAPEILTISTRH